MNPQSFRATASKEAISQSLTKEEQRLKMQLSHTTDLPTVMNQLQFKEGCLTSNEALREMYSDSSTVHLKRTARALASQSRYDADQENFETCDRLPSVALPLTLAPGNSSTKLPAQGPKRVLAAAPKTRIMPVSDPNELRAIVAMLQQRKVDQIEKHATTYNRLNASPRPKLQDMGMAEKLMHAARCWIRSMTRKFSNLLDRMALSDEYV